MAAPFSLSHQLQTLLAKLLPELDAARVQAVSQQLEQELAHPQGALAGLLPHSLNHQALQQEKTIRQQAEANLALQQQLLRQVLDALPLNLYLKDAESRIVLINQAGANLVGREPDQILGLTDYDLFPPAVADQFRRDDLEVLAQGEPKHYETRVPQSAKTTYLMGVKRRLMLGDQPHVLGFSLDITDRVRMEEALNAEKQRAQRYLDLAGVAIIAIDSQGTVTLINQKGVKMLGYDSMDEVLGKNWFDQFLPERLREPVKEVSQKLLRGELEPVEHYENPILTKDGQERLVAWHNTVLRDETGTIIGHLSSGEDITDRRTAETALQLSEERYRTLMALAPVGVFYTDEQGRVLYLNDALSKLTGLTQAEAQEGRALDCVPEPDKSQLKQEFKLLRDQDHPLMHEHRLISKTGEEHWVMTQALPIRNPQGSNILLGTVIDLTERAAMENRLQEATRKAEAASKAKSNFLANMSHELRTPMNGILGMAQLLMLTPLSEEQRSFCDTMMRAGVILTHILNDILEISKIEAAKVTPHLAPFSLHNVIEETQQLFAGSAKAKGIQLGYQIDAQVQPQLLGDANLLRQILSNLVGNAMKFTLHGKVLVAINLMQTSSHAQTLQFVVQDTGVGISPENQQMIFESFSQADSSSTRRFGGTGLGLSLAQHYVMLLGGRIQLESAVGQGSKFFFQLDFPLPLEPTLHPRHRGATLLPRTPTSLAPLAGKRVLLVEDDPINQHVVMMMLKRMGVEVILANNGEEGVTAFETGNFDLILMDILMPKMDGLTATSHIRHLELARGGKTPILALTAKALPSDLEQCLATGMDEVLTKPLDLDQLQVRLTDWLAAPP